MSGKRRMIFQGAEVVDGERRTEGFDSRDLGIVYLVYGIGSNIYKVVLSDILLSMRWYPWKSCRCYTLEI
jgi:hypothetical protein